MDGNLLQTVQFSGSRDAVASVPYSRLQHQSLKNTTIVISHPKEVQEDSEGKKNKKF